MSKAARTISGRPFPGGSPPGTPGKAARSSALRSRAGREGGACAWNQPSRDPGPPGGPRSAGAGVCAFPGSSHCRLVGEGPATGQVPRLRLGGLEEACGPSQNRTVQKCLLPCPALAQAKIPGLAAPFSAGGGRRGHCQLWKAGSRPIPGSATRRDGGILLVQIEPDLWPAPGPLVEPPQAGTTEEPSAYLPYRGTIPPAR